jgi:hypothetical protein
MGGWCACTVTPNIGRCPEEGATRGSEHQILSFTELELIGRSADSIIQSSKAVSLSLASPSWYFVQFADGATDFSLPSDWHQSINIYTAQAVQNNSRPFRMTTAYNHETPFRSQTFPQYTPQPPQGQTGSFSPGGLIPSYGGGPNPGYKLPFQSNPYPPPAYPAMPVMPQLPVMPQQPVYNVTNVYNTVSEQLQQQGQPSPSGLAKYNGMFTLLGGALKLAGTVLGPTLQNDWSNFNSN